MLKYNLTELSKIIEPPYSSFTAPAINEKGDVAFEGFLNPNLPPLGIFYANNFKDRFWSRTIIDNSEAFISEGAFKPVFSPSINNWQTVAFINVESSLLTDDNGTPVFDENNEPIIQIDRTTLNIGNGEQEPITLLESNVMYNLFAEPHINDRGTIAYVGGNLLDIPVDFPVSTGIYTLSNGEITEIASTDGIFSSFNVGIDLPGGDGPLTALDLSLSINKNDQVAFNAGLDTGEQGIFFSDGETIVEIANSEGEFDIFGSPNLNDEGAIAFLAQRDDGSRGIYINSYGESELVVDESCTFSWLNSEIAFNNNGEVAFFAELDDGSAGIYVASEIGSELVVGIGDELAGSEVVELGISQNGLNNQGQVAFQARLEDGNFAVFRANPISKPSNDNDRLYGDIGNNYIDGDAGDDLIVGNYGNDTLLGGEGDDLLRGGYGCDILEGGKGKDTLIGGNDADVFKLSPGQGSDLILDFVDGEDKFSLGSGLHFYDLEIFQNGNDTEIKVSVTGEILASLYEVNAQAIDAVDFI